MISRIDGHYNDRTTKLFLTQIKLLKLFFNTHLIYFCFFADKMHRSFIESEIYIFFILLLRRVNRSSSTITPFCSV